MRIPPVGGDSTPTPFRGAPPFPGTGPARRWVRLNPAELGSSYPDAYKYPNVGFECLIVNLLTNIGPVMRDEARDLVCRFIGVDVAP